MRFILVVLATVVSVAAVPGLALAQSAIVGVVKDASGAVVPGVTVEAASDALIERVKSATTDNSGQYRIVDLRPGMYVVTFALTGFQTVRRQGVQLQAEFNATVDAEMRVGDRQETITVTAEAPTVDVRSAAVVTRLDREVLDQIPTGQNIWEMAQLIPSINLFNVLAQNAGTVGGQGGATQTYMSVRGMSAVAERRPGRRHECERPRVERHGPGLLQCRHEPGDRLPDQRRQCRSVWWRRHRQHDSSRRRQPSERQLQDELPAGPVDWR